MKKLYLFISVLFSLAPSAQANIPNGNWKLTSVTCESGALGSLGLDNQRGIVSGAIEESLTVSATTVQARYLERNKPIVKDDYCETTFTEKWNFDKSQVHVSDIKLASRVSHGQHKCYAPYDSKGATRDFDFKFEVQGDRLSIIHPDMKVIDLKKKENHFCLTGSNYVRTYQRQSN